MAAHRSVEHPNIEHQISHARCRAAIRRLPNSRPRREWAGCGDARKISRGTIAPGDGAHIRGACALLCFRGALAARPWIVVHHVRARDERGRDARSMEP
jgi:hypothetical protein